VKKKIIAMMMLFSLVVSIIHILKVDAASPLPASNYGTFEFVEMMSDGQYHYRWTDNSGNNAPANYNIMLGWFESNPPTKLEVIQNDINYGGQYYSERYYFPGYNDKDGTYKIAPSDLVDANGVYYPYYYWDVGVDIYNSQIKGPVDVITDAQINVIGYRTLDGNFWDTTMPDSMQPKMDMEVSLTPGSPWTSIQDIIIKTKYVESFMVYVNDPNNSDNFIWTEMIPAENRDSQYSEFRISKQYFEDFMRGKEHTYFYVIATPSEFGQGQGTFIFDIRYLFDPNSPDSTGFTPGQRPTPEPPDNPWDMVGWLKYIADWIVYLADGFIYVLQQVSQSIYNVFGNAKGFFTMLTNYFSFLPTPVVSLLVVGLALSLLAGLLRK